MYIIADYETRYKPYDKAGRDMVNATWVKLPAKPKGDGLEVLLEHRRGLEVFGIWCLLLEATTQQKAENRGKLLNHKDEPATIQEIAKSISLKKKIGLVEYALSVLVEMGWVECTHNVDTMSTGLRKNAEQCSVVKSSVVKSSVVKSKYTSDFEIFWQKFKGRWDPDKDRYVKVGKFEAFQEWKKLTTEEKAKATKVADKVSGKYVPDACRWLKRKMFDDFRG